ncbi:hypothetical protein [Leptospira andrefontaineae]|uniref:Phage head morphogenesis domain-containing protein n=1 Tax=Leptospira andrefontaineae TaxID=2484976 RepID=A0A4R9GWT2_9LEPT|nr:hypothetical protein [Leptospira andrefontaineae]TGK36229.1 hypothetical protein EHO65_18155 [Leptospira andrefontaineae]
MKKFYQPVIQSKQFFDLTYDMVAELKTVFIVVQEQSLSLLRKGVAKKWSAQQVEDAISDLFDHDPITIEVIKDKGNKTSNAADDDDDGPDPIRAIAWAKLKSQYKGKWDGKNYSDLIKRIVVENQEKISSSILQADKDRLHKNLKSILPKGDKEKDFGPPEISYALKRSSSLIKGADKAKLLSQTRRDEIRKVIKRVLDAEPTQTKTGAIRKDISKKVETALKGYFEGYTKNSPPYGIPSNLHTIAVTETRTLLNGVRREYLKMTQKELPDFSIMKSWVHNGSLSKNARDNHQSMTTKSEIPMDKKFKLKGADGKTYMVEGPHDPSLPAGEIIGCNCEERYRIVKKPPPSKPRSESPGDQKDFLFNYIKSVQIVQLTKK